MYNHNTKTNPRITCNDGTSISVQASADHCCIPKSDCGPYTMFEVGYPTVRPHDEMMGYAKDETKPTETVYPYVPIRVVKDFIDMHGGIKHGNLPC